MRLHFHLLKKIAEALHDIFENKKYADKVIEKLFKGNKKLGSRDRRFIAETIYEIVRYHRFYQTVAASNESYNLLGVHLVKNGLDTEEFQDEYPIDIDAIKANLKKKYSLAVTESFPDWMCELGEKEFGAEEWTQIMHALNRPVSTAALDSIVERISSWVITRAESEISARVIGRRVMAELKQLDDVAYVRFASVYKTFKDVQDFVEKLEGDELIDMIDSSGPQLSLTTQLQPQLKPVNNNTDQTTKEANDEKTIKRTRTPDPIPN